jgi:hypothetical protein
MKFQDRVAIAERLQNTDPEAARLLTAAEKRSRELEAENARLREALEFYRDQWEADCDAVLVGPGTHDWQGGCVSYEPTEALMRDAGETARKALALVGDAVDSAPADPA